MPDSGPSRPRHPPREGFAAPDFGSARAPELIWEQFFDSFPEKCEWFRDSWSFELRN